jgi:hypothetical protein
MISIKPKAEKIKSYPAMSLFPGIAVIFCLAVLLHAADLAVRSYVDKNMVGLGQQFTLSVELSGSGANEISEPDLPDLTSFADYLGNGTSQSIQIVNGRTSSTRTINYYFRAKEMGKFEIGPVVIDYEGELYETNPIALEITDRGTSAPSDRRQSRGISSDDLFLKAEVSKNSVYVNEPVLLSYKIYTLVDVSQYSLLSAPDTAGFWVENLLEDRQRAETGFETVNGRQYTVATISKQVLFPTTAGNKSIQPMEIECQVRIRGGRRSLMDDFFSDPFSNDIFGRNIAYPIRSEPVEIEVLPLPSEGKPENFRGIVGDFRISGSVDHSQVKTNDVVTYSVRIEGSGNLRNIEPPILNLSPGIENYEPEVTENIQAGIQGLSGSKVYQYLLVPRTPGEKKIEEIRFSFFNPRSRSYQTQVVSPIVLSVEGSAVIGMSPSPSLVKENVRLLAQEIRFIKLHSTTFIDENYKPFMSPQFWGILVAPLFLIAIALVIRRHNDRLTGDQAYARRRSAGKQVRQRLKDARQALGAGKDEEFFSECGKALRGFAADQCNLPESSIMSESVQEILSRKEISLEVVREYSKCLELCEAKLFSPLKSSLQERKDFYQKAENAIEALNRELTR